MMRALFWAGRCTGLGAAVGILAGPDASLWQTAIPVIGIFLFVDCSIALAKKDLG